MRHTTNWERVLGVEVVDAAAGSDPTRISDVGAALHLIEVHHPVLLRRLQRSVDTIVIHEGPTGYLEKRRMFTLNRKAVGERGPSENALVIAHETAHAVFDRRGVRYHPSRRRRIERACVKSELRLAKRLPGGRDLVTATERKLDEKWWSDE
jgi:hypothetical protein